MNVQSGNGLAAILLLLSAACLLPALGGCKGKAAGQKTPNGRESSDPQQGPRATAGPEQNAREAAALRAELLQQHKLAGKVALIEFGAITCKLSGKGLDEMAFLHGLEEVPGLSYLRVEASKDDAAVAKYYEAKDLQFPVHRDGEGRIGLAFDATSIPTFVIVGKFGRVRYRGHWPGDHLVDWVKALQAEPADPGPDVALLGEVKLDGPTLLANTKLPAMAGDDPALGDLLAPGGLLLLFVDTTCPYSVQAMGEMPIVARALAPRSIRCAVVNIDGTREDVAARFGTGYTGVPLLYDETPGTKEAWNIQSVPTVAYLAPDKQIAYYGKALWADVARAVEEVRGMPPGTIRFTARGTRYG